LIQLKNARQANPDGPTLAYYSSGLSEFSLEAINWACAELEQRVVGEFEPRFPPLAELSAACRKAEEAINQPPQSDWTMERYRLMVWFDKWLTEGIERGTNRETLLAAHPEVAPAWVRWKNDHLKGTIRIPFRWCDRCEGRGVLVRNDPSGPRSIVYCRCRARQPADAC
jgi:hypothetical protein